MALKDSIGRILVEALRTGKSAEKVAGKTLTREAVTGASEPIFTDKARAYISETAIAMRKALFRKAIKWATIGGIGLGASYYVAPETTSFLLGKTKDATYGTLVDAVDNRANYTTLNLDRLSSSDKKSLEARYKTLQDNYNTKSDIGVSLRQFAFDERNPGVRNPQNKKDAVLTKEDIKPNDKWKFSDFFNITHDLAGNKIDRVMVYRQNGAKIASVADSKDKPKLVIGLPQTHLANYEVNDKGQVHMKGDTSSAVVTVRKDNDRKTDAPVTAVASQIKNGVLVMSDTGGRSYQLFYGDKKLTDVINAGDPKQRIDLQAIQTGTTVPPAPAASASALLPRPTAPKPLRP